MGWFLSKKSSKKKTTKRKSVKKPKAKQPWDPQRTWAIVKVTTVIVGVIGLIVGTYFAHDYLTADIGQSKAITFKIQLENTPTWLGPQREQQLKKYVTKYIDPNPLDRQSLAKAFNAYQACPWVEQCKEIRRAGIDPQDGLAVIQVDATYRMPVAVVEAQNGYHLVDANARRLPGIYPFHQLKKLDLIAILGAFHAPPKQGDIWQGDEIKAGLKMVQFLNEQSFADQIKAVDVSNHNNHRDRSEPQLRLFTERGVIRWGRAPGEEGIYEPNAEHKAKQLGRIAMKFGSIDAKGQVVEVYHDGPMINTNRFSANHSAVNWGQ